MNTDTPAPEFPRPFLLERIGPTGFDITLTANAEECAALARRMHLPAIQALRCRFRLHPLHRGLVVAEGQLRASIVQLCVVSLDEFSTELADDFTLHFVPAGTEDEDPELDSIDQTPYNGAILELGEAAAEQLALGLDPYPRKPGITLAEGDADVASEGPTQIANPFARLADLRRKH